MQTYYGLVQQDGESAFGISFPDIEGCFSAADDEHELLAMAQEALSLFAEDIDELPRARSIAELRADDGIREALAAGAFLIAVPLVQSSRKSRYNVVMEASLVRGVDEAARVIGISRSEFISRAAGNSLRETIGAVLHSDTAERIRKTGKNAKTAAASALTQSKSKEVTSAKAASAAARVMRDPKADKAAKTAAASALTQKAAKKK